MVARTDAVGNVFRERFDGNGNCVTKIDELGHTLAYTGAKKLDTTIEPMYFPGP